MKGTKEQEEAYGKIVENMEKAFDQVGESLTKACKAMEKVLEESNNSRFTKIIIIKKSSPSFWQNVLDKLRKRS